MSDIDCFSSIMKRVDKDILKIKSLIEGYKIPLAEQLLVQLWQDYYLLKEKSHSKNEIQNRLCNSLLSELNQLGKLINAAVQRKKILGYYMREKTESQSKRRRRKKNNKNSSVWIPVILCGAPGLGKNK